MLAALDGFRPRALSDLKVQIRAETHLVGETDRLIETVARHKVGYVVYNDHLEEGFQMARIARDRFDHWARKLGRLPEELAAAIETARDAGPLVPRSLCRLAETFDQRGVVMAAMMIPMWRRGIGSVCWAPRSPSFR